jgi:formate hydrogenlyase subunit 3/multisubunit Na+/H+ antiporter MnhD subunit
VSVVESRGTVTGARGLASRFPIAGAGFLIGALGVLGIPPLAGFAARWRLYGAAAEMSPLVLFVMLVASALAVLAYARIIAVCWWGPGEKERTREPAAAVVAIIGLSILLLLLGLAPSLMGG